MSGPAILVAVFLLTGLCVVSASLLPPAYQDNNADGPTFYNQPAAAQSQAPNDQPAAPQVSYYAQPPATPAPTPPPACPASCPANCYPSCHAQCCDPKPPPRALYLKRQEKTAVACEGHKLKLECPNKYDRIILYSTFYGRKDNTTCKHEVIPSKGYCAEQEMRVNEKVFDLCGHEQRCLVSAHNRFLSKSNTTICPGLYKYLKVVYKCSQHPKLYTTCPLPCKNAKACWPKCTAECCSPKTCPNNCPQHCFPSCDKRCCTPPAPPPPPPPASCPAACPSYCTPPCTPECCYGEQQRQQQQAMYAQQAQQQMASYQEAQRRAMVSRRPAPLYAYNPQQTDPQSEIPSPQSQSTQQSYQRSPILPQFQSPYAGFQNYARTLSTTECPAICRVTCSSGCPRDCCTGSA